MNKFKAGDRIKRPTRNTYGKFTKNPEVFTYEYAMNIIGELQEGEEYRIHNQINGEPMLYNIAKYTKDGKLLNHQTTTFHEDDLELWEEEWIPKIGDEVEIISNVLGPHHYVPVGKIVKVIGRLEKNNNDVKYVMVNHRQQRVNIKELKLIKKEKQTEMKPLYVTSPIDGIVEPFTRHITIGLGLKFPNNSDYRSNNQAFFTNDGQNSHECKQFTLPFEWTEAVQYAKDLAEYYRPKKPEFFEKTLGSKNVKVLAYKDHFKIRAGIVSKPEIVELVSRFKIGREKVGPTVLALGIDYEVIIPEDVRCLRIGCETENNLFSYKELHDLIEEHKKYFTT